MASLVLRIQEDLPEPGRPGEKREQVIKLQKTKREDGYQ